jgi:hypothetical protein
MQEYLLNRLRRRREIHGCVDVRSSTFVGCCFGGKEISHGINTFADMEGKYADCVQSLVAVVGACQTEVPGPNYCLLWSVQYS